MKKLIVIVVALFAVVVMVPLVIYAIVMGAFFWLAADANKTAGTTPAATTPPAGAVMVQEPAVAAGSDDPRAAEAVAATDAPFVGVAASGPKLTMDFTVEIQSGTRQGQALGGTFSCYMGDVDHRIEEQRIRIDTLDFTFGDYRYGIGGGAVDDPAAAIKFVEGSVLFRRGRFAQLRFRGGPGSERFAMNLDLERVVGLPRDGGAGGIPGGVFGYWNALRGFEGTGAVTLVSPDASDAYDATTLTGPAPGVHAATATSIRVPATGASAPTEHHGRLRIEPDSSSRWDTSPARWSDVDYRGHRETTERASNGMPYLQLCYSINDGPLIPIVGPMEVDVDGEIVFAPIDVREPNRVNNIGHIDVWISAAAE